MLFFFCQMKIMVLDKSTYPTYHYRLRPTYHYRFTVTRKDNVIYRHIKDCDPGEI